MIRLASTLPKGSGERRTILRSLLKLGKEHATEDAKKKWLQDHKGADPKNHTVSKGKGDSKKEEDGGGKSKSLGEAATDMVRSWAGLGASSEVRKEHQAIVESFLDAASKAKAKVPRTQEEMINTPRAKGWFGWSVDKVVLEPFVEAVDSLGKGAVYDYFEATKGDEGDQAMAFNLFVSKAKQWLGDQEKEARGLGYKGPSYDDEKSSIGETNGAVQEFVVDLIKKGEVDTLNKMWELKAKTTVWEDLWSKLKGGGKKAAKGPDEAFKSLMEGVSLHPNGKAILKKLEDLAEKDEVTPDAVIQALK
jgi:hypothetical protein